MKSAFHRFTSRIVRHTDGTQAEKEDLQEELLTHLTDSRDGFIQEGFGYKEAECKAMADFGDADTIGDEIQRAMFPYRKEMILFLAFFSIIFSFSIYVVHLYSEGDAYIYWLLLSVLVSAGLFTFIVRPISTFNRRICFNTLFLIHGFLYLYGPLLASALASPFTVVLFIWSWMIILLDIALIFRTTIYDYPANRSIQKQAALLHVLNITIGIAVIGFTLFFIWAMVAFSDEWSSRMLLFLVPLAIWLIAYIVQMILLSRKRKAASYIVLIIPILLLLTVIIWVFPPL